MTEKNWCGTTYVLENQMWSRIFLPFARAYTLDITRRIYISQHVFHTFLFGGVSRDWAHMNAPPFFHGRDFMI